MIAVCKDNTYPWRSSLTKEKEYKVIRHSDDPYASYPMVEILCDDDEIRVYRANRFSLIATESKQAG